MGKLSANERCNRSLLLSEVCIPYLRERHPMGSVVVINLSTAEFVVGAQTPEAMELHAERSGAIDDDACMEPIHWPDSRSLEEPLNAVKAWALEKRSRGSK